MADIDNRIGFKIHKLDMEMKKLMDAGMQAAGYDDVTLTHGWILKYLYDNRNREIYQRDIEKHFAIGRSTVTTIIQLMEKRDLVCRESVECDARLKRVMLTEKGFLHHEHVVSNITRTNEEILGALSLQEKENLLQLMEKISGCISECKSCSLQHTTTKMKED